MRCVEPLRVLIVTRESLRRDSNEGSVLISLFEGMPVELAHICCKPEPPDNDLCRGRYFHLTDRMALEKLLKGRPMGAVVPARPTPAPGADAASGAGSAPKGAARQTPNAPGGAQASKRFYDFFRTHNWSAFYLLQDLLWALAGAQNPALDAFIDAFRPDLVFAPLTPYRYANRLQGQVARQAGVPAVTYLYDDIYSLKQLSFSPLYWLRRFAVRGSIRKNLPLYRFAYTMTEQQKAEYGRMLGIPMRVLRKSAPQSRPPHQPHEGIRLIYAGGVYFGRDKTLARVADAVRGLRAEGLSLQLHIYTSSPLKRRMQARLNDGAASFVHPAVPGEALAGQYAQSDIALHVESFRKKDALATRLSFSTKIVDCLASGCAVLAICPQVNAGWQYLRDEGAALCVGAPGDIAGAVRALASDAALRGRLAQDARRCLDEKHAAQAIQKMLYGELSSLVEGRPGGLR